VFGDLCFSAIKRQAGIKDYSNLIPGHGGMLDRFDSMIVVAPLVEALLEIIPVAVK
jgi:phosphatidate cytidylyltransferase